jgi:hypothetical protein
MDGIAIKGGSGGPDAELPRRVPPAESGIREVHSTVEVGRQGDEQQEARQGMMGMEQVNDGEGGDEPLELSRKVSERAAAIDASDAGTSVKKPVQSGIQRGGVEHSGSAR